MPFSYDRVWADLVAMVRANMTVLMTLSGAFLFLPAFALWIYAPMPAPPEGADSADGIRLLTEYYQGNWPFLLLVNIVGNFGQAAILILLLDRDRPTVGDALGQAARILPVFFLVGIVTSLAIGFGLLLFIIPGVFLLGRFIITAPVLVAEEVSSPAEIIRRAWSYTAGLSWRVAGLTLLIGIVAWVALSAASSVMSVLAGLLLSAELTSIVTAFADAISGAALSLLIAVMSAAIYRQVRGNLSPLKGIFS